VDTQHNVILVAHDIACNVSTMHSDLKALQSTIHLTSVQPSNSLKEGQVAEHKPQVLLIKKNSRAQNNVIIIPSHFFLQKAALIFCAVIVMYKS